MAKPLIGISGRRWAASVLGHRVPSAMKDVTFDLHFSDYPKSVSAAGGVPVELTRDADVDEIMSHLDGLVISGGADVDPAQYGAEPDENLGTLEPDRDEWELALLRAARSRQLPILAICRGFQLVNVLFGGTLVQHVDFEEGVGHPAWDSPGEAAAHSVEVVPGTLAGSLYATGVGVNSLHHQIADQIGDGLIVSAIAPDGVVEGLETPEGDLLALQWHPELMAKPDASFTWLVESAAKYLAARG
jgi:putative glutamine amidotransferase